MLKAINKCPNSIKELSKIRLLKNKHFYKKKVNYKNLNFNTYFISDGNYIKIGKAVNISSRLITLQCGTPNKLVLLLSVNGDYEKFFQKYFKDKEIRGEWYNLYFEDFEEAMRVCNKNKWEVKQYGLDRNL